MSLFDAISTVLTDGYKLGLTYNVGNESFIASLTGRQEGEVNYEMTISGFAMRWDDAVRSVLFKHFIIAGEGSWAEHAAERDLPDMG